MVWIFLHDSWSAVKILPYPFRLSCFIVGMGMSRYLPLSITVPAGIRGYLERWDFMACVTVLAIRKLCCWAESSRSRWWSLVVTDVRVRRDSGSSPRSWDVSRGWARCSLLGVVCESLDILGVLSAWGTYGAVGHVSRSLRFNQILTTTDCFLQIKMLTISLDFRWNMHECASCLRTITVRKYVFKIALFYIYVINLSIHTSNKLRNSEVSSCVSLVRSLNMLAFFHTCFLSWA